RIEKKDLVRPYLQHVASVVDLERIAARKFRFVVDPMHGAARSHMAGLLTRAGIDCREIHGSADPLFGGFNPEPIDPHINELRTAVLAEGADAGFATDGDADR